MWRASRDDVLAYAELHIEQGPVLEAEGLAVGVVTAINGASRLRVTLSGMAGHAGTVPMNLRRDALAGGRANVCLPSKRQSQAQAELVGTVGPPRSEARRHQRDPGRGRPSRSTCARRAMRLRNDGRRGDSLPDCRRSPNDRKLDCEIETLQEFGVTACASGLMQQMDQAVARQGFRVRRLPSGAGHDGMALGAITDICMLFVRCKGGISHSPLESISAEDAAAGARVLLDFIEHFAPLQR